ncbi:LysR family transcriptional regulator [Trinickia caryophylli]|uniref:DNA-binding transcriptional regulator, LysR family n=1 Tax=Trinickia caryophylli TaxID=28094 RepID=A0A1X7FDB7_TRICW|nr:LysR family transcriptional regulator [Trinickia caryophylli]PMS10876.1 LysR family transcriptional regulator [Trinickia caryophylli]TRX18819.1 LysR family transcriptional regulator [Trinickia caryophylli]WQE10382.1 LysR family transcriptional regulator [Trinickia caryophylli]SMF49929.1 DNA-binding transcriptional regulator, LysR family [Trinickia caryophylli]GLU34168.1 LysR family transcriptional regulator [Trinickia caryophylli]
MLNPQWLRTFAALAELGHFTKTAERLGLTQAAVSQHLRHLEQALGPLLIRRPRSLELTPAGRALLEYCDEVDCADERLKLRLTEADRDRGEISIITPGSIGLSVYPLLLELQQMSPGLSVRHRFAPDSEVLDGVLTNRYELGIVTLKPDDVRLEASYFAEEPLELVVPAGECVHTWEDLERLGFIDHPDGKAMASRLLSRRFPGNPGVRTLPCRGFSNQVGLILEPVARGFGFTVIPRHARTAFGRPDAIEVVECGATVVDTLWLIHRAEWPVSARALRAIAHLQQSCSAKQSAEPAPVPAYLRKLSSTSRQTNGA